MVCYNRTLQPSREPRMPWIRIFFLLAALAVTSGYRFRCYFACVDQTSTQNDYVEQRDRCREYAQLKIDMASREAGATDDRGRKGQLVSLFSQCMANNGWTVPDGKGEGSGKLRAAAEAPAGAVPATPVMSKAEEKALTTRSAECSFARQSAKVSAKAAARADACDLECNEGLRVAPDAPRPAACADAVPPRYSKGNEQ
jgi:hypothetical protein